MSKYHWYEKLFYHLQLKEKKYFRSIFIIILLLMMLQILLLVPSFRQFLVLVDRFEGQPVRFLKKF